MHHQPIQAATHAVVNANDPRLTIRWDIAGRSSDAALDVRNSVTFKAKALLDASGLLIDWHGASISDTTVETTFTVTDFGTARNVVWSALSVQEIGFNCRIIEDAF